jgi:glycerol-3-phosphate acyltransferase PlsY
MAWPVQFQSTDVLPALGCAAGAYAIGCFATGYYLVRARTGQDIREVESGSIGARNVGRVLGRTGFWLTVCGDFAKGALAVLAARYFTGSNQLAAVALLFVVIGHLWPAPLHWRGGKGVVTSGGAMLIFDYRIVLAYGAAVAVGFAFTRRMTMPGLIAYLVIPFVSFWLHHSHFETTIVAILTVLILFAHRENIGEAFPALAFRRSVADKPHPPKS